MWEYHIFRYDNHGLISATVMTDEPMLRHRIYPKKTESRRIVKDVVLSTILAVSNHRNTKMSNHTNI